MPPPRGEELLLNRAWQGRVLTLLILLTVGIGFLGVYTLHTSPALSFEAGLIFSLSEPALRRIEHLTLESTFFQRLPEFFTPSAESTWW